MLNKKEMLEMKKAEALLRQLEIEKKGKRNQESGYVKSQFETVTSENRLLGMGFYKSEKRVYRKKKKEYNGRERVEWLIAANTK